MPSLLYYPILIKCPESVISAYNAPESVLEGTAPNRFLRLYCEPSDCQLTNEQEGESTRYISGFNAVVLAPALVRRRFKYKIKDDRAVLRLIIEELAELSISTTFSQHIPIELRDYVRPEKEDVKNAIAAGEQPYTIRYGLIVNIDAGGTWSWRTQARHQEGFSFEYQELTLRTV